MLLERLIIDLILQCSTVKGACEIAGVSWDEAWGVMSRAVARGHARKAARPITYIGVDEKAFRKGHRYHTIVCDLQRATVEFVAEDRKTESLAAYYAQLTDAQRRALHAVAMDMWEAYIGATRDGLPDGAEKIVFDRFHIMREMTKAVDTVRKQEHLPPPKYPACRSSSDTPPRTTGSVAAWHCGGQSPRSARPDAGNSRIATGAGRRAHTRPGPHSAHTRIRPANGSPPDTVGRRLRWRIGAETRGDSWERLGGAHTYTTYRGVLKQPEKQKSP